MGRPDFEVIGDSYRFIWRELGLMLEMERLLEKSEGLSAEITVGEVAPARLLHSARLNIMSSPSRATFVKALGARRDDIDWGGLLEQACFLTKERYREGDPVVDLRTVNLGTRPRWLLAPYVEQGGATILFADGGTGKSLLAMAMGIAVAGGAGIGTPTLDPRPVLYLDWEADAYVHAERLAALVGGRGGHDAPELYYRRQVASLVEAAPIIKRDIDRLHIGFVIVDSMGAARGGEPESADMTIRLFGAARSLGVPWMGVDHVSKGQNNASVRGARPFGSTYTHDLARITWGVEQSEEPLPAGEIAISLTNHKSNNGRLHPRHGYRLDFRNADDGDHLVAVVIDRLDLHDVPDLARKLPLAERILGALRRCPEVKSSPEALAETLDADLPQVRARLADLSKGGRVTRLARGEWGLVG